MWREVALQHRITSISTVWIAYLINYLFILISGFVSKWTSLQAVWVRNWRAHWKKAALPLKENQSGPGRSTGRGFSTSRWDCCSSVWKSGMKLLKTAWAIESDFFNLHHRFIHFICFGFFFFFSLFVCVLAGGCPDFIWRNASVCVHLQTITEWRAPPSCDGKCRKDVFLFVLLKRCKYTLI